MTLRFSARESGSPAWRAVAFLAGVSALLAASVFPVAADSASSGQWGTPTAVTEVNSTAADGCPVESPNGKQLFIASTRPGGFGKNDIWVAERQTKQEPFGPMQNLGSAINTADQEFCPTSLGGGWLLFVSDRAACGASPGMTPPVGDIYLTRQRPDGTFRAPQHLGCAADGTGPNLAGGEFGPSLRTTDGVTYLYFSSTGANGNHDIYRSLADGNGGYGAPEPVTELNSAAIDQMPNVSADGTEIVFASNRGGNMDIWTATYDATTGLWSTPVAVSAVNTAEPESRPSLSGDGKRLYFGRGATSDIYVSTRSGG
jgi:Tol biopolymer transport system component